MQSFGLVDAVANSQHVLLSIERQHVVGEKEVADKWIVRNDLLHLVNDGVRRAHDIARSLQGVGTAKYTAPWATSRRHYGCKMLPAVLGAEKIAIHRQ